MLSTRWKHIKVVLIATCYPALSFAGNTPLECDSAGVNLLVNQIYKEQTKELSESKEQESLIYEKLTNAKYQNGDFKNFIEILDASFIENTDTQLLVIKEIAYDSKSNTRTCEAKFRISIGSRLIEKYQKLIPGDTEFRDYTNKFRNVELGTHYTEVTFDKDYSGDN